MKKFLTAFYCAGILFVMLCLVIAPEKYIATTFKGILLWATCVLPSLLPFFFLTQLLCATGLITRLTSKCNVVAQKLFRTNGVSIYVFAMSVLSGYPVGASLICELYEQNAITSDEATRMSTLCSTSGPLFVIGSVGTAMFNSKNLGVLFFAIHILSSVICGAIFRFYGKTSRFSPCLKNNNLDNVLYNSVYKSVVSVLIVGGFVGIFYTISQILVDFNVLYPLEYLLGKVLNAQVATPFLQGVIECTTGASKLGKINTTLAKSLACALISFGGVSIICQSAVFLQKCKANVKIFILSKTIQMAISFAICYFALLCF